LVKSIWQEMQAHLDALAAAGLLRRPCVVESASGPRIVIGGREVVCLCGNDYLGLANDPAVKAAATEAVATFGVGAGASRLVSGTSSLHVELERRLAAFKGSESAVVAPTGYMANHVAIHALAGRGDLILCDKFNHASIIDAALACGARVRTYAHCDAARLKALLERHRGEHRRCLIVTDSLFSMDGDLAPLAEIVRLKKLFDAQLLVDEAHATGVLGEHGRGAAELLGVEREIDATVGTLSKALGAMGGFVAGPGVLIETIRNAGRAFMYTTALPPAICAAAIKALEMVEKEPQRRRRLLEMSRNVRERLGELKSFGAARQTASSNPSPAAEDRTTLEIATQIIPVIIGDEGKSLEASGRLLEAGFLVPAIRPPTVHKGTSRLRVSLSASHEQADLDRFVETLRAGCL
jgi:8-amino-7-oxononanoate synthase